MVRVQCPYCKRRFRTEIEAFGRTAVCTKCFETFKIGESRPPFHEKPTGVAEDSWIGVEPPAEEEPIKHCAFCDAPMETGAAVCPACGRNQVTGIVQKAAPRTATDRPSIASRVPIRVIAVVALVAALAGGAYWIIASLRRSAEQLGAELVDQGLMAEATRFLRNDDDRDAFARAFGGRVTDENLPSLVESASTNDGDAREAALRLIECGQFTNPGPIVALARSPGKAAIAKRMLDSLGAKRIVQLTESTDETTRRSAAEALCAMFDLDPDAATVGKLSAPASEAQKIAVLNELCGPAPQAVGTFVVVIGQVRSPFSVQIEQIGHAFYLHVGRTELRTTTATSRKFEIPIVQWCRATGPILDERALAEWLRGLVALSLPSGGTMWGGVVRVTVRRETNRPLPGFLPFDAPPPGVAFERTIHLER